MKKSLFTILCLLSLHVHAQHLLSGIVTDNQDKAIPGAIIQLQGTQFVGNTDVNGKFQFKLKSGDYQLQASSLGYLHNTQKITVKADQSIRIKLAVNPVITDEITVAATRAGTSGMAVSTLSKEEIKIMNTGQDVPYLLQLLPSVVITSDAGTGIGYTGIRIRGSDQSRINVTINGIPLNDAESQQVFWVNLPDFASSTENIQVQRGVGSSTNGAAAFGGSINLLSNHTNEEAFTEITSGYGSFNSFRNTATFSTGKISNHFSVDGRLSKITSDGYVDRGSSDLKSFYLGGSYSDEKNLIRFNAFSGKEITYQSWNGIPESRYNNDRQGMQDYIDRNALSPEDAANLLNSGRTYNFFTYDNQVDNYQQDHYQLHFAHTFNSKTSFNAALHYTKGRGYYEEYKNGQDLNDYSIAPVVIDSTTITESDLIRRKWLDNDFYGVVFGITSAVSEKLTLIGGGSVNRYDGQHFGDVIWARFAGNSEIRHRYYDNDAIKDDRTVYVKGNYNFNSQLSVFGDLQYRNVAYDFIGLDPDGVGTPSSVNLNFFNPKAGFNYKTATGMEYYASIAVANKEPNRDDFTESTPNSRPKPEQLIDYEAGFRYNKNRVRLNVNGYFMQYNNQLVLNGSVNDVGNYTRINIDKSYRAGLELEAGYALSKKLAIDMNLTISRNRIDEYTEFNDAYDVDFNYIGQTTVVYNNTPIAFSPDVTGMGRLSWKANEHFTAQLINRFVGRQYLDNSGLDSRALDSYSVLDARLEYKFNVKGIKDLRMNVLVNNILGEGYASNGYTYGYIYNNQRITENFLYPQAMANFMAQLTLRF